MVVEVFRCQVVLYNCHCLLLEHKNERWVGSGSSKQETGAVVFTLNTIGKPFNEKQNECTVESDKFGWFSD